ncbi:MAG: hypothetical protein AB1714_18790 [Acidobacteriota bacterium]
MIPDDPRECTHAEKEIEQDPPKYVAPRIVTYTSEQILEQIGPALACTGSPTCTLNPATPYQRKYKRRPRPG